MRIVFQAQSKSHTVQIDGTTYIPGKFYTTEEGKLHTLKKKSKPLVFHPELEELNIKEQELSSLGKPLTPELVAMRKRINKELHEK